MFDFVFKTKESRERKSPKSRLLRLEALENRELLSVAPALPSVLAEFATEPVCVAEETLPTVDLAELNAEFERNAELNATSQNDAPSSASFDGVEAIAETSKTWTVTSVVDMNVEGSLRYALSQAAAGDSVVFAPQLKGATIVLDGAELVVNKGITIDASALYDAENNLPGITINAAQRSRVFNLSGGTAETPVSLIGLQITRGYVATSNNNATGGGVYASGVVNFTDCAITNNTAYCTAVSTSSTSKVWEYYSSGGGVKLASGSSANFENCLITGNRATANTSYKYHANGQGGGVRIDGGSADFVDCRIQGNQGLENGGGFSISAATVSLIGCSITSNSTTEGRGGGVSYYGGASLTILDSVFSENVAGGADGNDGYGGGVYSTGPLTIENAAFIGNRGVQGSGIYAAAKTTIINSLIAKNTATDRAGGVYFQSNVLTATNCAIVDNADSGNASYGGGGIYLASGTATLRNSIVARNTSTTSGAGDCQIAGGNLIACGVLSSFTGWSNAGDYGLESIPYDATLPLFTDSDAGDYTLAQNSQAIDRGNDLYSFGVDGNPLQTDMNGNVRFSGLSVDLGPCEYDASDVETPSLTVTTAADVDDPRDGLISLREAIRYAANPTLGATIAFAPDLKGETIVLDGTELAVSRALTIDASALCDEETGAPGIAIDGDKKSRVFNLAGGTTAAPIRLIGLTITNGLTSGSGGGVYALGRVEFANCVFSANEAANGGALSLATAGSAAFVDCKIERNAATEKGGGAYLLGTGYFTNCSVVGNAASQGGGVYVDVAATFAESAIIENAASQGGGVYGRGTLNFANALIADNEASVAEGDAGGGVYLLGVADFANCAIAGNSASGGGRGGGIALAAGSSANFRNGVVAQNTSSATNSNDVLRADETAIANAWKTLSTFNGWTNATDDGVSNYVYDAMSPLFADAESGNYALAAGSQAINAGDDALAVDAAGNPLTFDLAGKARFGGVVDLGPYEYYYTAPSLATPTLSVEARGSSGMTLTIGFVSGAASFEVEYSTSPTFAKAVSKRVFSSSGEKNISGLNANSTYYVRVKAVSDGVYNDSAWAKSVVATDPIRCSAPTLEVAHRDAASYSVTLGYVSGATVYALEYSTDPNFATFETKTFTSSGAKKFAEYAPNATTYVRVKALGGGAYVDSPYSAPVALIGTPNFTLATRDSTSVTIDFTYVAAATSYVVEYTTDPTFATFKMKIYGSCGPKKLSDLSPNETYYARVRAEGEGNCVASFTTAPQEIATPALELATPTLGLTTRDASTLSLSLGYVSNASSYLVEYSTDPTYATSTTRTFASSGAKKLNGVAANSTYYVRVKAVGVGFYEDSGWANASIQTAAIRLGTPALAVEYRDASSLTVTLGYVSNAASYSIEYSTDANFSTYWTRRFESSGSKKLVGLETDTTYYVRVRADGIGGYGDSFWSEPASGSTAPTFSALLTDEAFATPFDDFDFFAEEEDDERWSF